MINIKSGRFREGFEGSAKEARFPRQIPGTETLQIVRQTRNILMYRWSRFDNRYCSSGRQHVELFDKLIQSSVTMILYVTVWDYCKLLKKTSKFAHALKNCIEI